MNIKGLDVSEFQGEINWERVKNAGYQFLCLLFFLTYVTAFLIVLHQENTQILNFVLPDHS